MALIHGRSRTDHSVQNKEKVGPMQKLSERLNTFADAATLLMIIALIAFAAWLLAHSD
jgi:flagellar biogenesis protein FliO